MERIRYFLLPTSYSRPTISIVRLVNPFMPYTLKRRRLTSAVFNELLERLDDAGALSAEGMIFDDGRTSFTLTRRE